MESIERVDGLLPSDRQNPRPSAPPQSLPVMSSSLLPYHPSSPQLPCPHPPSHGTSDALNWFCDAHGFAGWFPTSAKRNINIQEANRFLVEKVLEKMAGGAGTHSRPGMNVRRIGARGT